MIVIKMMTVSATLAIALLTAQNSLAQAVVGKPAPAFSATDTSGKQVSLAQLRGKLVVLEWTNPGCPFVGKHYDSGNMPATQKHAIAKGATWVSIQTGISDDTKARSQLQSWQKAKGASPILTIIDSDAKIAIAYRATTTPHMFIVNTKGVVVYAGAIDNKASANPADIATATNYVTQAIDEVVAGKAVSQPVTKSYGCSVKYPARP